VNLGHALARPFAAFARARLRCRMRPPSAFRALAATALLLAAALPARAAVPHLVLAEVEADPDTTLGEREFVEVWNPGPDPVSLGGWKVRDAPTSSGSTNTFTFPPWTLAPNGRVVVWGGGASDARGPAWSNPTVWNNAGDGATLLDASGAVVDWLGYGATTPPTNLPNATVQAKPGHGQSLQFDKGAWVIGAPTPGTVPGAVQGSLNLTVANAAPTAAFGPLPSSARPGAATPLSVQVADPNGDDDASWTLAAGGATLASGTRGGLANLTLVAPASGLTWDLTLTATDRAGLVATATASVPLRYSDLVVQSAGPLGFAPADPGSSLVESSGSVTVRNVGDAALSPRLDVSAFSGPASFPAEGHLWVQVGANGTWMPYTGPLMPLPDLPAGGAEPLRFQLRDLPSPLPAGAYGTSFAVVPA